jgi:nicotinamidase-related amidase
VRDTLLLVDIIHDFRHEDGETLLASYRARFNGLIEALSQARNSSVPIVYANDSRGRWDGDAKGLVRHAVEHGLAGGLITAVAPKVGDRFLFKPRYSAFDSTPLAIVLEELGVERLLLAGTATEMCVAQTAIAARELGFKVSVLVDACATLDERNERIALDYLENVVGVRLERSAPTRPPTEARSPAPGAATCDLRGSP